MIICMYHYRKTLIPHCDVAFEAAKAAGAYGATISGSGSTLIAYVDKATYKLWQMLWVLYLHLMELKIEHIA